MDALLEKTYIERALHGDAAAFAALVNRHKDHVFTLLLRMVRQRELAEELTQDVFLKAFRHLPVFRRQAKFSTWLYRIAYNTAISEERKRKLPIDQLDENILQARSDETPPDNEHLLMLLQAAVERLPAEEAALITLFYTENKSVGEISKITGWSQTNVKVKIHRVRRKLREQLKGEWNDE
jgi:RNA polymerase sigma-70 factor (ECF subfamily)